MKQAFLQQFLLAKLAVVFLTRLPVSIKQDVNDDLLNKATGYFGFVGLLIASLCAGVFWLVALFLPLSIAVLISMAFGLMLTGAFHEDGLADTADGFGGGWSVVQKLTIMKDSRLGTYGASALCMSLLLKYQGLLMLAEFSATTAVISLLFAHVVSRVLAVSIIPSLDYVQLENESKTKPVAKSLAVSSVVPLLLSLILVSLVLVSFIDINVFYGLGFFTLVWLIRFLFITFTKKQIGGYTGDVLGAAQQIFELTTYLFIFSILPFQV
jgi:adenosylcobinamide-GDP ribazoletransferase